MTVAPSDAKRIVVALGGNALLRRGEDPSIEVQRANVRAACAALAPLALDHELVVTHGNGPQVGLLAQASPAGVTFDVLGAETEGMIGYLIEQELGNLLPFEKPLATILTMTEVAADDPAFDRPTKFVGPVLSAADAEKLAATAGWHVARDGDAWRRVVPSPRPLRIFEIRPVEWLLERGAVVICAGGGGIPTAYEPGGHRRLVGVDAVIDKDLSAAVLARDLGAEMLVIATDAPGLYLDWGTPSQRLVRAAAPAHLTGIEFPAGSMGPKVAAATEFVAAATGGVALIGALTELSDVIAGRSGTRIAADVPEMVLG